MTPHDLALIPLAVVSTALATFWCIATYRILRVLCTIPTARAGLRLESDDRPLTVVVPAHNEAESITPLIETLRQQTHARFRVVLALDRCTDNTEAVAREAIAGDPRFEIVLVTHCPDDWAGKVHAAHTGYTTSEHARSSEHLLFTDADCTFHPEALRATAALLESRDLDLLSLFSTLATRNWFERLAQPAASFELGRWFPLNRANAETGLPKRPFANGQFMLFRHEAYRQLEGHAHPEVRAALLEDIAFAQRFGRERRRTGLLLADGIVACRMYETWEQFTKGWKRIYTESANRKPARLRNAAWQLRLLVLAWVGAVAALTLALTTLPDPTALDLYALIASGLGLSAWTLALICVHRAARAPLWLLPLWPVGQWLVARILSDAAKDLTSGVPTSWGGRSYTREARH